MPIDLESFRPWAEQERGKNKRSGPLWSLRIRFTPLFDAAICLRDENAELRAGLFKILSEGTSHNVDWCRRVARSTLMQANAKDQNA